MKQLNNTSRKQRVRKDKIRASISYSKKRGNLLSIDVSSNARHAAGWCIGEHFDLRVYRLKDRFRLVMGHALVNGYRMSSSTQRRGKIVFPIREKLGINGAISKFDARIFGDEIFLDIPKSTDSIIEKTNAYPTLFDWAYGERLEANV